MQLATMQLCDAQSFKMAENGNSSSGSSVHINGIIDNAIKCISSLCEILELQPQDQMKTLSRSTSAKANYLKIMNFKFKQEETNNACS